jgi:hypothetical protein
MASARHCPELSSDTDCCLNQKDHSYDLGCVSETVTAVLPGSRYIAMFDDGSKVLFSQEVVDDIKWDYGMS